MVDSNRIGEQGEAGESKLRDPLSYRDFHLRFSGYNPSDGSFKVWVEGQAPGGAMSPDNAVDCSYEPQAFWRQPESGLGGPVGSLENRRLNEEGLFQLGKQLASLALPEGEVRSLFEKSLVALEMGEGLRLRLHIDAAPLAQLPWEYMALTGEAGAPQPSDFLALRREISIVRTETVKAPPAKRLKSSKARLVGILSSPDGQTPLQVENDQKIIKKAVEEINLQAGQDIFHTTWGERPASIDAMEKALAGEVDIFHFAGHGIFDPISQEGQILLERDDYTTEFFSSSRLASLLRASGVRLTVLGACLTGRRDGQNVWSGVAPALAREQIPAILASQFTIDTENAERMIGAVYPLVLGGFTVDEAVSLARGVIFRASGLGQRDWGSLVLYMGAVDGVLFDITPSDEPSRQAERAFYEVAVRVKDVVNAKVTGAEFEQLPDKDVNVNLEADNVKDNAEVTGLRVGSIGSAARPRVSRPSNSRENED